MSDCVIFVTDTTTGAIAGTFILLGVAQEDTLMYLTNFGGVIGGSDKATIMGGHV